MSPPKILLDFPSQFESKRLLIRCPQAGDGVKVHAAIVETAAALQLRMPWAKKLPTVDECESFARKSAADFITREDLILSCWEKESAEFVLSSGLHPISWEVPSFEIGYWVRASKEGQGYVTEAVRAIALFAIDTLAATRLVIRCDNHNPASARVAERCGFSFEGLLRSDSVNNQEQLRDTRLYSLLASERERLLRSES